MSRAVIVKSFGGPYSLVVEPTVEPHCGPGQVRVRITAAGLNPVDLRIAEGGATAQRFDVVPPFVNGNDFAGVIDEVGLGVSEWAPGDRVYGGARCRAQVDYLIVDDLDTLNRTPDAVDDVVASVLDIAGRTALAGIDTLELQPDDTVLISAAAGGCGIFACQLAQRTGATVLGTAGIANHDFLRSLGVVPLSYGAGLAERVRAAAPGGVTAVFDGHGVETIELALELGVPPTRINSIADRAAAEALGAISVGRAATETSAVREIAHAVAEGDLIVHLDGVFPVERAREAYERLDEGHVRGKLALTFVDQPAYGAVRARAAEDEV